MSHSNQLHNDAVHNNNNTKFPQKRTQSEAGKILIKKNSLLLTVCFSETETAPQQNAIRVRNKKAEWRR